MSFILKRQQWTSKGLVESQTNRLARSNSLTEGECNIQSQPEHSSMFQMKLFGFFSILYIISEFVLAVSVYEEAQLFVANYSIGLVCCLTYLTFVRMYKGVYLKNRTAFNYSIAIMIGALMWVWIVQLISPLWGFAYVGTAQKQFKQFFGECFSLQLSA